MSDKKYIRFIDSNYNTLFYVPDGGSVRVTAGYDGRVQEFPCRYVGEMHVEISNNVWHICQFAEFMERNGNTYEPVQEIGDLSVYAQRYYDRQNRGADGRCVPYYNLIEMPDPHPLDESADTMITYAYCLQPQTPDKTFFRITGPGHHRDGENERWAASIEELCDDPKICARVHRIVNAIHEQNLSQQQSVEDILHDATVRSEAGIDSGDAQNRDDVPHEL